MKTHALTATFVVALALHPASAHAQHANGDPARAAFDRGMESLRASRYGEAIGEFETSYRIEPDPGVLYNLALAYRGAGRNLRAAETFEQYLRDARGSVPPQRESAIRDAMTELRRRLGLVEASLRPALASVSVDGRRLPWWNGSTLVDPGTHVFTFTASGFHDEQREVTVTAGGRARLDVELRAMTSEERAGGSGRVIFDTVPVDAVVYADGQRLGRGSLEHWLSAGSHVVEARASGYASFLRRVTVAHGDTLRLSVSLERQDASRTVFSRWWFWTLVGAAVAGTTAGVIFALREPEAPYPGTAFNVQVITVPTR